MTITPFRCSTLLQGIVLVVVLAPALYDSFLFKDSTLKLYRKVIKGNYGNWCGKRNTWLKKKNVNGCCKCDEPITNCRQCKPPKDDLDEACMQHDYCVHCNRTGVKYHHFCECEKLITGLASRAYCSEGSLSTCGFYRSAVRTLFNLAPCICRRKDKCDFTIAWRKFERTPCPKMNYRHC